MATPDLRQVLYVSPGFQTIWGRTADDVYANPRVWIEAIHPDDRDRVEHTVRHKRDCTFQIEYRIVRPDGTVRWIHDRGYPVRAEDGRVDRIVGIAEDVTARKAVEERLRRSERLLAEAQRLAQIGSWSWDFATRVAFWSDELYRIFGVEAATFTPHRDAMALVHPDDRDTVMRVYRAAVANRRQFDITYRIRRPDGEERMLHSRGFAMVEADGEQTLFGTTQDITDRFQASEALRRSEKLLRVVLDTIPVAVFVMDRDGDVMLHNPAAERIWSDVIAKGADRYPATKAWWHGSGTPLRREDWASYRALTRGETSLDEVVDIEAFDGTRKIVRNSAIPIRDAAQTIVGAVVVNEDVTARMTAARELKKSEAHMRTLAMRLLRAQDEERRRIARMLHETTAQDLAALRMMLWRLLDACAKSSAGFRRRLEEAVEILDGSIKGVRTLSYLLHPPGLDEAGLPAALKWYADGFAERSGIGVTLDVPQVFPRLSREVETTLFRVVQEALINIHRHAASPTATIRLTQPGEKVLLEVEDRGRGIASDVSAAIRAGHGAFGVGIAAARERLKQLGGALHIETGREGTVVRATVPMVGPEG
jgi:PAS domain S-box-containing protein